MTKLSLTFPVQIQEVGQITAKKTGIVYDVANFYGNGKTFQYFVNDQKELAALKAHVASDKQIQEGGASGELTIELGVSGRNLAVFYRHFEPYPSKKTL